VNYLSVETVRREEYRHGPVRGNRLPWCTVYLHCTRAVHERLTETVGTKLERHLSCKCSTISEVYNIVWRGLLGRSLCGTWLCFGKEIVNRGPSVSTYFRRIGIQCAGGAVSSSMNADAQGLVMVRRLTLSASGHLLCPFPT